MTELTYSTIIRAATLGFRVLGQRFHITGLEHLPRSGAALVAFNHIGYVDFVYGGLPAARIGHPSSGAIWLKVNDETRQQSDLKNLLWPVQDVIVHLSKFFVLKPGDLIYTGTPAGVGAVKPGDRLHGAIEGVDEISIRIAG